MFIMSWHEQIKLEKIQTLHEGSIWNTNSDLVKIREDAANFMAKFANTSHLDVDAETYSDEENTTLSGSDAKESDSSDERYGDSDGDDAGDSAATNVRAPQLNRVRFSASGKAIFEPVTPLSDASSAFDSADFEEQAQAPDAAKASEVTASKDAAASAPKTA